MTEQLKNFRPDIITRPAFVTAIILLAANDFYFKYAFPGFVTGKLSDFAGLFVFPYFFSSFLVRWAKMIYVATAGLFAFWKSPLSGPLLIFFQSLNIGMTRTVDYSDLVALLILPVSYVSFHKELLKEKHIHRFTIVLTSIVSIGAFSATTIMRLPIPLLLDSSKAYNLPMSKQQFLGRMNPGFSFSDSLSRNVQDSLFYLTFHIPNQRASVKVLTIITEGQTSEVKIQLDSVLHGYMTGKLLGGVSKKATDEFKSLTITDFENYFKSEVIDVVQKGKASFVMYDNKLLEDSVRRLR